MRPAPLPRPFRLTCRREGVRLTRHVLLVWVGSQRMDWLERADAPGTPPRYRLRRRFVISTSRFGLGQQEGSNRTPLGLHRVAARIGGGWPIGTVFQHRQPVGLTWNGLPRARIAHRILRLGGLEPGFNRGGDRDSFCRCIYLHGIGDEPTLGRPDSCGCVHLAAAELMPLYDRLPVGTLVWISAASAPASPARPGRT